jgi:hypothetical protein
MLCTSFHLTYVLYLPSNYCLYPFLFDYLHPIFVLRSKKRIRNCFWQFLITFDLSLYWHPWHDRMHPSTCASDQYCGTGAHVNYSFLVARCLLLTTWDREGRITEWYLLAYKLLNQQYKRKDKRNYRGSPAVAVSMVYPWEYVENIRYDKQHLGVILILMRF